MSFLVLELDNTFGKHVRGRVIQVQPKIDQMEIYGLDDVPFKGVLLRKENEITFSDYLGGLILKGAGEASALNYEERALRLISNLNLKIVAMKKMMA